MVRLLLLLLEWHENAPRADCNNDEALLAAAREASRPWSGCCSGGNHVPRDEDGHAVAHVRRYGHDAVVQLLLSFQNMVPAGP